MQGAQRVMGAQCVGVRVQSASVWECKCACMCAKSMVVVVVVVVSGGGGGDGGGANSAWHGRVVLISNNTW